MTMLPIDHFSDRILDECPGIPPQLADRVMLDAVREFCIATRAWKMDHEPIDLVFDQVDYPVADVPPCAILWEADHVKISGSQAWPYSEGSLLDATDTSKAYYHMHLTNTLTLWQPPLNDETGGILIRSVLIPTPTACELPDDLFYRHIEMLERLAKVKAMTRPKCAWSNPQRAGILMSEYAAKIGSVATHVRSGNIQARHRVRSHV